ncbi:hypothetical protein Hanom_Chr10g00947381 [Helianthus anomalus]
MNHQQCKVGLCLFHNSIYNSIRFLINSGCWCMNISTMEFRIMASRSYALPWISYLEGLDKGSSWDNNGKMRFMLYLWMWKDG